MGLSSGHSFSDKGVASITMTALPSGIASWKPPTDRARPGSGSRDGSIGWTFSRAVPILDKHQDVIARFGAASDITDRKKIEEKLLESESRFSVALKNSPILVYTTDADLRYTSKNEAVVAMAASGLRISWLSIVSIKLRDRFTCKVK